MTNKDILHAMSNIDPKLILDAEPKNRNVVIKEDHVKHKWVRWGMIAACVVCSVISLVVLVDKFLKLASESKFPDNGIVSDLPDDSDKNNPSMNEDSEHSGTILPSEDAYYSAQDISKLFDARKNDAVPTSYYTKVYVPSVEYLKIPSILTGEKVAIYEKKESASGLNEKEFVEFLDKIAPGLLEELGESMQPYEIQKNALTSVGDYLEVSLNGDNQLRKYFVQAEQTNEYHTITVNSWSEILNPTRSILLGDVKVEVDQTKTDSEILKSLEQVKEKLFDIFGVEFEDAKIVRKYDGDGTYGVSWLTIFFFDEDAHPLNRMSEVPVSDYICISFDNFENFENDILSETILQDVYILYRQNRMDVCESYVESKSLKMISLSEAEEMLAKGYVFGGHACPLCMEEQEAVTFDGYDKVGMEYVMGQNDKGEELERVPFYVFYKYIKDAQNGNQIYAKTYVPAIAVSGCEEYFESQKQYHTLDNIWEEEQ